MTTAREEFERRYPNAMPILEALERTVARLQADNERMRLLYEIQPLEKNAVDLMFSYRAVLEEVRSRLAYADGIEVEESLRTIDRVLDRPEPSV